MQQSINYVFLQGILGLVSIRDTEHGKTANLSLMTESFYEHKDGSFVIDTCWHNVTANESERIKCFDQLRRGAKVSVSGFLRAVKYQDANGQSVTTFRVIATDITVLPEETALPPCKQAGSIGQKEIIYRQVEKETRLEAEMDIAKKIKATGTDSLIFQNISECYPAESRNQLCVPMPNKRNYLIISAFVNEDGKLNFTAWGWNDEAFITTLPAEDVTTDVLMSLYSLLDRAVSDKENVAMEGNRLVFTEAGKQKYGQNASPRVL